MGKPIIAYSIEAAIATGLFNEIMVSTDNDEIANVAQQYGAKVPFYRSIENSDDFAGTFSVIKEVLNRYDSEGQKFQFGCCIYPTAPLISTKKIHNGLELLTLNSFDTVFAVCQYSYPIQRALKIDAENSQVSLLSQDYAYQRSQDIQTTYHDAGQFYWFKTELLLQKETLFTENSGAIVLNEMEVQDIDTDTDWKLAELKYSLLSPNQY